MTTIAKSHLVKAIEKLQEAERDLIEVRVQIAEAERNHAATMKTLRTKESHYAAQINAAIEVLATWAEEND
jgi:mRNA-degrading endonuclease HigB of HigAB toxin-antitoxin module